MWIRLADAKEPGAARRPLPNGRGCLRLVCGGKITDVQQLALELGVVLQARWLVSERAEDYNGGW